MRTLAKNKQPMKYALFLGQSEVMDWFTDEDGNKYPLGTGSYEDTYSTPLDFQCNLSMGGSEAEAMEYGLSIADYEATMVYENGAFPLAAGSLIWTSSEVKSLYEEETEIEIDGEKFLTTAPIPTSADYRVLKISKSLNFTKAILKAVNK